MFLHKNKLTAMTEIKKEFVFANDSKVMHALLNEIISFIKIHLPSDAFETKISNCKQALIELLTNGVKHSATELTLITVNLVDNRIEISKRDTGRSFFLKNYADWPPIEWPLQKEYVGEKIKIYEDDFSHLFAIIQSENRISFELEEYPIESVSEMTNLLEHYGLLILTKVSDEFIYLHDPATNSNLFKSVIKLS